VAVAIVAVLEVGEVNPGGGGSGTAAWSGTVSGSGTDNSISSNNNNSNSRTGCEDVTKIGMRTTVIAAVALQIEVASSYPHRQSSRNWLTIEPECAVKETLFYSLYTLDIRSIVYRT